MGVGLELVLDARLSLYLEELVLGLAVGLAA
jgi:hypothetical protein